MWFQTQRDCQLSLALTHVEADTRRRLEPRSGTVFDAEADAPRIPYSRYEQSLSILPDVIKNVLVV